MAKLDVELENLLARKVLFERNSTQREYFNDPEQTLYVSIEFDGDITPLKDAGLVTNDLNRKIASGSIKLKFLKGLSQLPSVISIIKHRLPVLQLDESVQEVTATNIWSRSGDNFHGYTGRDVIIGIIDTGIDLRHKNFIKPDGTTRIRRIWDQTIYAPLNPPQAGETAPAAITGAFAATLGYGVEYTTQEINNTLTMENPPLPVRHRDEDGHGTHVAGIAAGNGKQAGGCHGEYQYIGVAPEADLVIVRLWGLTKGDRGENQTPPANPPLAPPSTANLVEDAIRYIFEVARTQSKPVVINCSFGLFSELMDGSAPICGIVNSLLTNNSTGRSVVWAAGNDGDAGFHAAGTVPASGTLDLEFKIYPNDTKERRFRVLYSGTNLDIQVVSPVGGANGTVAWVTSASSPGNSSTANGTISGGNPGTVVVTNAANRLGVTITPPNSGTPPVNGSNVANTNSTNWRIQLRNNSATPKNFNAFCLWGSSHDRKSPKFLDHTTTKTLTEQATGAECVTVGSYKVGDQLAPSSGRGPTLDARTKPELCAPGVDIDSTGIAKDRADDCANCCCECCQDWYVSKSGTSMAAPHVTGGIALMLHKNPNLTHTDIKTRLINGCDGRPPDTPPGDIPGWGGGRLSTMNTVNPIPQVNAPVPMMAAPQESVPSPLLQQFLGTRFGPAYYELAQKYFREILNLVNTNKKVATVWHRNRGPAWVRVALNAFFNPEFKIPLTVSGHDFRESIDSFLVVLKRFASPQLLCELERCEPKLDVVRKDMTLLDLMNVLGEQPLSLELEMKYGS